VCAAGAAGVDAAAQVVQLGAGELPVKRRRGVVLYRDWKASSRAASASAISKPTGLITLHWMMENTTSTWFNHEAWTGRCIKTAFGQAAAIRSNSTRPGRPGAGGSPGWQRDRVGSWDFSSVLITYSSPSSWPSQIHCYKSSTRPALAAESGSRGKIHDRYRRGRIASSSSQRCTVDCDTDATRPPSAAWAARSAADHRDCGTPRSSGGSHAIALTSATTAAANTRGRPLRLCFASEFLNHSILQIPSHGPARLTGPEADHHVGSDHELAQDAPYERDWLEGQQPRAFPPTPPCAGPASDNSGGNSLQGKTHNTTRSASRENRVSTKPGAVLSA
jgi:hypothetical protein